MMDRLKKLNRYQQFLLLFLVLTVAVFTVLYAVNTARKGFLYKDALLIPETENGETVYSGRINGAEAEFTVSEDKTVTFRYSGRTYGPYTVREDASAVSFDRRIREGVIGVEVRKGEEILFRGGYCPDPDEPQLVNKDGWPEASGFVCTENGISRDEQGNIIDPMEPSVLTLIRLAEGPELTGRGSWLLWFCGVLLCAVTAVSILYAYELFRFSMFFRIRNAERAEPSDWEIVSWYISWTATSVAALAIFITGLH